jgi:NADPH:quinone reductase and related Zn-dependent oxidoreductases
MKAAYITKVGSPDVIIWGDLPEKKLEAHEITIRVEAIAVDHVDTYLRAGSFTPRDSLKFPYILGHDVVGTVLEVGRGVTRFKKGDRVWSGSLGVGEAQGATAEKVTADADIFFAVPKGVSAVDMAAVIHSSLTACRGIIVSAYLRRGEIIYINGAAGNVGSALIQLALARGAQVIAATHGDEKTKWCYEVGADLVLDYKDTNLKEKVFKASPRGVDVFWDTSRTPKLDLGIQLLDHRGRAIVMAGAEATANIPIGPLYRKECSIHGFALTYATPQELSGYAEIINRCIEDELLRAKIAAVLPLEKIAEAHLLLETDRDLWGKIVLTP